MNSFHGRRRKLHWVVSREVDLEPFHSRMVQNGEGGGVWLRNNLVSTRDCIWQISELIFREERSVCAANVVLYGTREMSVPWSNESELTYQTLREDLELTLGFEVLLSKNTYGS